MYLLTKQYMHNPYPVLSAMRETAPAVPVEANGYRMWVITRHADVRRVLTGRGIFKDMLPRRKELSKQSVIRPGLSARLLHSSRRSVLERDGADHRRMRAVLGPTFTREAVARREPRITEFATRLLDDVPVGEPVDLIARFARPLAAMVLGDVVGLGGDQLRDFPVLANSMVTGRGLAEIEDAGVRLFRFAQRMVEEKRRAPGDDLYSRLVRLRDEENTFDDAELASTFMVLMVGGCEPINALANSLLMLLTHPEQVAMVRADRTLVGAAVDEGIRLESPFRMLPPRFSDDPFELDGLVIPPREFLVAAPATANRDPDVFSDPESFCVTRRHQPHLAFGHGPHHCLGVELGRLETEVALNALLDRYRNIELAVPPAELAWQPGMFMRRVQSFPVVLR
jgi:cytochrome P450